MLHRLPVLVFAACLLAVVTLSRTPVSAAPATAPAATQPIVFGEGDLQVIKVSLPKPQFVGTVKNPPADVEKQSDRPRPAFMAPAGTVNLALKRPVTSSDSSPVRGKLEQITDGDKEAGEDSVVEIAPGVQWVQVDLGKPCDIYAILLWHFHANPRIYNNVVIQVSDDPDFITATTIFNNDQANEAGLGAGKERRYIETYEGKLIDGKRSKARYIRLYSNGNSESTNNHYIEIEVYGVSK